MTSGLVINGLLYRVEVRQIFLYTWFVVVFDVATVEDIAEEAFFKRARFDPAPLKLAPR